MRSIALSLFALFASAACGSPAASEPPASTSPLTTAESMSGTPAPLPTMQADPTGRSGLPLLHDGPLQPGDYELAPPESGWDACWDENPDCVEAPGARTIGLTLTVPSGWEAVFGGTSLFPGPPRSYGPPDGMDILIGTGGYLHEDPCLKVMHAEPMIPVDPTSDDSFVDALVNHPLLDVSTPHAISLGGFDGKYLELTAPDDLSACVAYRPWEPGLYAQGPLNRWRLWVADVDGTRMTVVGWDFPGTPESDRMELEAIVNSIRFLP